MNPLMLTFSFLLVLGVLTSSQIAHFKESLIEQTLYENQMMAKSFVTSIKARALFEDFKGGSGDETREEKTITEKGAKKKTESSSDRANSSLDFNLTRLPNNSRLNLFLFLSDSKTGYPDNFSFYHTSAKLMRRLYGNEPFFQKVPNAEIKILDALLKRKELTSSFLVPDALATISLDDDELQEVFAKMLMGSDGYPSLLNYITFDRECNVHEKKINLIFASPELLLSLFNDEQAAKKLITLRDTHLEKIIEQETNRLLIAKEEWLGRQKLKDAFKADVEQFAESNKLDKSYLSIFDYSLGKKGTVLIVKDELTGITTREKLKPKPQKVK